MRHPRRHRQANARIDRLPVAFWVRHRPTTAARSSPSARTTRRTSTRTKPSRMTASAPQWMITIRRQMLDHLVGPAAPECPPSTPAALMDWAWTMIRRSESPEARPWQPSASPRTNEVHWIPNPPNLPNPPSQEQTWTLPLKPEIGPPSVPRPQSSPQPPIRNRTHRDRAHCQEVPPYRRAGRPSARWMPHAPRNLITWSMPVIGRELSWPLPNLKQRKVPPAPHRSRSPL
mmetsp:Transcript_28946/g.81543  ORF Transcript_28946/g.81543 Transcript_28946/m.81543 type:complete len:231 (-) Transcript_28946:1492-2184(-)